MPATSAADLAARTVDRAARDPCALGRHVLADLHGCPPERIASVGAVEPAFLRAVAASGATVLSHRSHQFDPDGVTIVVLLAESHATIHTWPERGYAGVDFFTCGESMDAATTVRMLVRAFAAQTADVQVVERGVRA